MNDKEKFQDNQNETVLDTTTDLLWVKEDSWQKEQRWLSWDEAIQYAQDLNNNKLAGFQDWRLPTAEEALTLVDKSAKNVDKYDKPVFLDPVFPAGPLSTIWTIEGVGGDAYIVNYNSGESGLLYKSKCGRMAARPVRGQLTEGS